MSFPKFSEWMSLKEDAPQAGQAPAGAMVPKTVAGPNKSDDPKVKMAVAANLKKNKGKLNPNEIIDAVSKGGGSIKDMIKVAKDVGEGS